MLNIDKNAIHKIANIIEEACHLSTDRDALKILTADDIEYLFHAGDTNVNLRQNCKGADAININRRIHRLFDFTSSDATEKSPLQKLGDEFESELKLLLSSRKEASAMMDPVKSVAMNCLAPVKEELLARVEARNQNSNVEKQDEILLNTIDHKSLSNLSMQILSGFMAAIGCAAVATAFIVLNAASLGTVGLVVAGLGAAALLAGVGLFATHRPKSEPVNELQAVPTLA